MLPFTSLVPLLIRADAPVKQQNNSDKSSSFSQQKSSSSSTFFYHPAGDQLDLTHLQPSFVRIFKPRCRTDPYVVAMGDLRPRATKAEKKVRRLLSHCPRVESQSLEAKSLLAKSLVDESVNAYLANISSWAKFDVFKFETTLISSFRGLSMMAEMAMTIASRHNLFVDCNVSPSNFYACMREISNNYYRRNPYHTALHACDVLHAMHCLISEPTTSSILMPLDKLSLMFAAVCHDVAHPGVNQGFIIKTHHVLHEFSAGVESSLLERHHFAVGWSILMAYGLLNGLDPCSVAYLKSNLLELILATDIARHATMIEAFRKMINGGVFDAKNDLSHRTMLMCILMKCADISNPCRPWSLCEHWSGLICEEFFKQGDVERALNKPISPGCDRDSCTVARIQKSFIPIIAQPLFELYHAWSNSALSERLLDNLNNNLSQWVKMDSVSEETVVGSSSRRVPSSHTHAHHVHQLMESESVVPETAETSIRDVSTPSDDGDSNGEGDFDDESANVFDQPPIFPFGATRRKYSMPAALLGSADQQLLVTISSGRTGHGSPGQRHLYQHRRLSLMATPTCRQTTGAGLSAGLGFTLSESKHSEVLKELEKRRHQLVNAMDTLEQSTGESSLSSSDQPTSPKQANDTAKVGDCNHIGDQTLGGLSSLAPSKQQQSVRRSSLMNKLSPRQKTLVRSPTAPPQAPVVPLTVYVSAVSSNTTTTNNKNNNKTSERQQSTSGHSALASTSSIASGWSGQRRGSEGTMLSSYIIGAEHSCAVRLPQPPKNNPSPNNSSNNNNNNNNNKRRGKTNKGRKSLPPPVSSSLGWAFIATSKDDCTTAMACRTKENWTRTGKRWSDGCLNVPPQFFKSPLINS